jgi:glutamine synthetase
VPDDFAHDARPLVRILGKEPRDWQRADLVEFCLERGIRVINLRFAGLDGKLRELRVPVRSRAQLDRILAVGERVDGSSLFPGLFAPTDSDLYAVPVLRWAFLNPWMEDELEVPCRFAGRDGSPCRRTPDTVLAQAAERLRETTGASLLALAEVEFYLVLDGEEARYGGKTQRNYHQSAPYLRGRVVADDILRAAAAAIGHVKYCHAEVGYVDRLESDDPEIRGGRAEQYELELDLVPIEDLGTWIGVVRWIVRGMAALYDSTATFLPKLEPGAAGNGLHLHLALERDGVNTVLGPDGDLSDDALRVIGGLLGEVRSLTAFGNTVAASFLRLVPGQEAPTRICWGRRDRSSLIRIPLGFTTPQRMDQAMNPAELGPYPDLSAHPTLELRSPDGSAFVHLLLAAVATCVGEGLSAEDGLERARALEAEAPDSFDALPANAVEAAAALRERRGWFEARGFPPALLDLVIEKLRAEDDAGLAERLRALPAEKKRAEARRVMHKDLHKH